MSLDEKWGIVYENAIQGAGSGMVMAMMMILGLILLLGAVVAAVAFLAPEFAAAWAAVLAETTILGASLGTWITATLTALGLSASLTAIVNEFRTVNTAINNAQTVGDLQSAGRDWGYNTAEAIAEIMVIVLTHASVRSVVERLERDIARRFRGRSGSGVGSVAAEAATSATEVAAVGEVEIAAEVAAAGETVTGATEVAAVEELAAGAEDVAAALPVRRPPLWWGRWNDYSHATIYGEEYAVINGRFYTRHAVDRMQPSGYSWSRHVSPDVTGPRRGTGGQGQIRRAGGDYGRSVAPRYVEEVIATGTRTPNPPLPGRRIRPGEQRTSYSCGSVEVITESYNNDPAAIVITIETH
ncbi:MAG: hypothetical protein NW241_12720 [Bacteroidia bacterium]|nr:hypothetical protein [Bacteroidia bacterium]